VLAELGDAFAMAIASAHTRGRDEGILEGLEARPRQGRQKAARKRSGSGSTKAPGKGQKPATGAGRARKGHAPP
jgi:hypothetical protein